MECIACRLCLCERLRFRGLARGGLFPLFRYEKTNMKQRMRQIRADGPDAHTVVRTGSGTAGRARGTAPGGINPGIVSSFEI